MAIQLSAHLATAATALAQGFVKDITEIFALLGVAAHNVTEKKATVYAQNMAKNVAMGETANAAKTLENKVSAMMTGRKITEESADKLSSKTLTLEEKADLKQLAETYEKLGINGDSLTKIQNGQFTRADLKAYQTATTGKSDSISAQQTMDNLEVSKLTNALSNAINLITKMLEAMKTNMEKAIGR